LEHIFFWRLECNYIFFILFLGNVITMASWGRPTTQSRCHRAWATISISMTSNSRSVGPRMDGMGPPDVDDRRDDKWVEGVTFKYLLYYDWHNQVRLSLQKINTSEWARHYLLLFIFRILTIFCMNVKFTWHVLLWLTKVGQG